MSTATTDKDLPELNKIINTCFADYITSNALNHSSSGEKVKTFQCKKESKKRLQW